MYGFNPSIKELTAADKVIRWHKEKKQFEIASNKSYFFDWAIALFLIAIILGLVVSLPLFLWSIIAGSISLVLPLLFILAGARFYFLAGNDERKIVVDANKNVLVYSNSLAIPFKTIKQLSRVETVVFIPKFKFRIKKHKAWEIIAEDHRGNKAPLIKCENEEKINLILKELSLLMGVPKKG